MKLTGTAPIMLSGAGGRGKRRERGGGVGISGGGGGTDGTGGGGCTMKHGGAWLSANCGDNKNGR